MLSSEELFLREMGMLILRDCEKWEAISDDADDDVMGMLYRMMAY